MRFIQFVRQFFCHHHFRVEDRDKLYDLEAGDMYTETCKYCGKERERMYEEWVV